MNRTQQIAGVILNVLADWSEPADEAVIHSAVNARVMPVALTSEFQDAMNLCEQMRWITGVRNPLRGTRWAITDAGRAQRHS